MNNSYLTTQLIAYIGNKRSLLPFLRDVFAELQTDTRISKFSDLFAGSGSVSRLAKYLGFSVHANDWEAYSHCINTCYIVTDKRELDALFTKENGIEGTIEKLHRLPPVTDGYIGSFYAPRLTENADYRKERLFYTRENGVFIDTIREGIESMYPGWDLTPRETREKQLLIASLLYQAATHANTSGVFKAFHKGFGGHGGDALTRITKRMKLLVPVLIDGAGVHKVTALDAAEAAKEGGADICYLDPPYNQHQYGSNYHMLNTILRWDKPRHPIVFDEKGRLRDKGGIRKDWKETKSDFCYKSHALPAFRKLIDAIDARHIVLSYNTEGIIPYEDILDVLSRRGRVDLFSSEYVTYRGGRQSISRKTHNVEFVIVCSTKEPVSPGVEGKISRFFLENKVKTILKSSFHPEKIKAAFDRRGDAVVFGENGGGMTLPMQDFIFFDFPVSEFEVSSLPLATLTALYNALSSCVIGNKYEECLILLQVLRSPRMDNAAKIKQYEKKLINALKKIAHKKYAAEYRDVLQTINSRGLKFYQGELEKITLIAEKRVNG